MSIERHDKIISGKERASIVLKAISEFSAYLLSLEKDFFKMSGERGDEEQHLIKLHQEHNELEADIIALKNTRENLTKQINAWADEQRNKIKELLAVADRSFMDSQAVKNSIAKDAAILEANKAEFEERKRALESKFSKMAELVSR